MKKNGGPLSGHLYDARIGVEWFPWHNVGLGAEYGTTRIRLHRDAELYDADLDINLDGPSLFARFRFRSASRLRCHLARDARRSTHPKEFPMRAAAIFLTLGMVVTASAQAADAASADARLNATYKALMGKLASADQQRLRDAQRAWLVFRDKECRFLSQGADAGSMRFSVNSDCVTTLVEARTGELQRQLDCAEGDPNCVPHSADSKPVVEAAATDMSCSKSAGKDTAARYVRQCIEVSPATHPPCNADNSCDLILDEIRRGCAFVDKDGPAFCTDYR